MTAPFDRSEWFTGLGGDALLQLLLDDADRRSDPYPVFDRLRHDAPVHRTELGGAWLLSRHADCAAALRDPRLGKGQTSATDLASIVGAAPVPEVMRSGSLVHMNPPHHTRLRGLVNRAFTPPRVAALRAGMEASVDELLRAVVAGESAQGAGLDESGSGVDLLDALAFPLPVQVIGDLVGVPRSDQAQFRMWVRDQALAFEPGADADVMAAAGRGAREMAAYFSALVRERRRSPADDLVSALLAVRSENGEGLTKQELVAIPVLLFGAGFETTMNLIGNAIARLLWEPGVRSALVGDGGAGAPVEQFVEEVLRFDSPVQIDARVALERSSVGTVVVEPGEWVVALLGAANRDPLAYGPSAHQFEAARFRASTTPPVLSFSGGIHRCLGAPLARLEGVVAVERLLAFEARHVCRFEPIDEAPNWRPTLTSRGLESLPVVMVGA